MDPRSLSLALRRIAAGLDNSQNPSRELVARELSGLITRIASPDSVKITESTFVDGYDYDKDSDKYENSFNFIGTLNDKPFDLTLKVSFNYEISEESPTAYARAVDYHGDFTETSVDEFILNGKKLLNQDIKNDEEDSLDKILDSKAFQNAFEYLTDELKDDFSESEAAREAASDAAEAKYEASNPMAYRGLSWKDFI